MDAIIDVAADVSAYAKALAAAGVRTVIRYYSHANSSRLPTKCLTRAEADALQAAGLSIGVVFQQRGGAEGDISDLDADSGGADARRALALAAEIGQPEGSAIYFAVDYDFTKAADLASIKDYFLAVNGIIGVKHAIGVYGSGRVCKKVADLVEFAWLAGATGWSGTKQALDAGDWTIFQSRLNAKSEIGGFFYDGNRVNPSAGGQFGQWPAGPVTKPPPGLELTANVVAALQQAFNPFADRYGIAPLKVDGIAGPKTRAALALAIPSLGD